MSDSEFDNTRAEELLKQGLATGFRTTVATGVPGEKKTVEMPVAAPALMKPEVNLNKAKAVEPAPGFGQLRESTPGQMGGMGDVLRAEAPPPVAPPPPAAGPYDQQLQALMARLGTARGAPRVAMNEDMRRGIAGQQEAMRGVIGAMEAEGPGKEVARAGMQVEGAKYIQGLEQLRGQQNQDFAARRQQMAQDEAALAQAREQYNPSRVLRDIGKSPVSTSALTFAAGLVGALKGSAGQIGPNEILQEVDKAVERDTKMQLQNYEMLTQGIQTGRSNFGDLMRMGASQQEALTMTAMASMDQHKRALEFAQQRVAGAKEKGAIKEAIAGLDFQRGKLQLDIDMKNAANYVAMNRARQDAAIKLMEMQQKLSGMDPETRQKTMQSYLSITNNDRFGNAKESADAVGRLRRLQMEIPIEKQKQAWETSVKNLFNKALGEAEARASDRGDIVLGAVARAFSSGLRGTYTPEQMKMLNLAQQLVNTELKRISGGSVTSGEAVRNLLSRDWSSYEGFKNWMDSQEQTARSNLQSFQAAANIDPNVRAVMDGVLVGALGPMDDYQKQTRDTAALAQGATK